jgi:hypothetical protein
MITMTCLILWIPAAAYDVGVGVGDGTGFVGACFVLGLHAPITSTAMTSAQHLLTDHSLPRPTAPSRVISAAQ